MKRGKPFLRKEKINYVGVEALDHQLYDIIKRVHKPKSFPKVKKKVLHFVMRLCLVLGAWVGLYLHVFQVNYSGATSKQNHTTYSSPGF